MLSRRVVRRGAATRAPAEAARSSGTSTAASEASPSAGRFCQLATTGAQRADESQASIGRLLEQQKEARLKKQQLTKDIRNERRKRNRLTKKARLLTTEDLLQVIAMRERDAVMEAQQPERSDPETGDDELPEAADPAAEPVAVRASDREPSPVLQEAERVTE